jgi:hypothetical protein
MAILAFEPEEPGVNGWLGMASDAIFWRSSKDSSSVTVLASDLGVSPIQWEDSFMVKIRHTIDAIVARGAVRSVLLLVFDHECCPFFSLGMAAHATCRIKTLGFALMAIVARQ